MRIAMLASALLASSALVRMPDGMGGGGPGAAAPETAPPNAGGPGAAAPSVDNIIVADGAQKFTAAEIAANKSDTAAPEPKQKVSIGRIVIVSLDENGDGLDGHFEAAGIVTLVNEDGSINVKAFAPGGGADVCYTGVKAKPDVDAMEDGADKNAARSAVWDWPARI